MKKIFFKLFIVLSAFVGSSSAFAYNKAMPAITNEEITEYAQGLISKGLYTQAKPYYYELKKRGDFINSTWGLALVDVSAGRNLQAIKKLENLSKYKNIQADKIDSLKAELLVNLAEEAYFKGNVQVTREFLDRFQFVANSYRKSNLLNIRAVKLQNKIDNQFQNIGRVNVGVIIPLTGKLAPLGKEIQKSLILTMYDKRLSNVNLIFEDNKSTQEGSIVAATKIISKMPTVIIGPILRDNVLAANSVVSNTRIPLFALSNDESIAGRNIFINNVNLKEEARNIARFAVDNGRPAVSCLVPESNYGFKQQKEFVKNITSLGGVLRKCSSFDTSTVDIKKSLRKLLDIDESEKHRVSELKNLEREFEQLGNAMDDDKIARMEELKKQKDVYDIDFTGIFIPTTPNKVVLLAPQLAFYDVDFSNNVLFLGNTSWDSSSILKSNGEHLHFSRFLSLKTPEFKKFEKEFYKRYKKNPRLISAFASDVLYIAEDLNQNERIYSQLYRPYGFYVLTGNVRFNGENMPERVYGVNKISRRKIKSVEAVKHQRTVELPKDLSIERKSVFNNWFGF